MPRASHRSAVVVGALAALASACSLFTALDDLSEDERVVYVNAEGGGASEDGTEADAASSVVDASADGDSGLALAPCPAGAFCKDFDDVAAPADGWTGAQVSPGATISRTTTQSVTAPGSFASEVPDSTDFLAAVLSQSFNRALGDTDVRFWLYAEKLEPTANGVAPFAFLASSNGTSCTLRMYIGTTQAGLYEQRNDGTLTENARLVPFTWPNAKWVDVHIEVRSAANVASISLDGTPLVNDAPLICDWSPTLFEAKLGIHYSRAGTGQRLLYDHVVFEAK